MVKGNGGEVGLASSPGALRRWVTAGPPIARLLKSFEYMTSKSADCMDHHEQSPAPQKASKINVQAFVVSQLMKLEIHLKTMEDASSTWTQKSLLTRLPCLQLAQSSPGRCSNITNLLRRGSKREQNQSKSLCERKSCMCLCNSGRLKNLPWQSSAITARCFRGFTLHARQGKRTARIFQPRKPANTTITEQTRWYMDR